MVRESLGHPTDSHILGVGIVSCLSHSPRQPVYGWDGNDVEVKLGVELHTCNNNKQFFVLHLPEKYTASIAMSPFLTAVAVSSMNIFL